MLCRHLSQIWKGNQPGDVRALSYSCQNMIGTLQYTTHTRRKRPSTCGRRIRQVSTSTTTGMASTTTSTSSTTTSTSSTSSSSRTSYSSAFAKNLFIGQFSKDDVLPYPEITVEEFNDLNQMVEPIEKFFSEGIDSKEIDHSAKIDEKTMQGLKDLGLFGQQIPQEYGGLELSNTEYARMAEVTALDGAIAVTLAAHQAIGLKGILIAGNNEQKARYLPKLATGEHVAAFCLTEPSSGSDAASVRSTANLSRDGKHYLLNGSKIWISNGGIADVFTVFAQTGKVTNEKGVKQNIITAFIVERSFGGVTSGKPEDKLGIRGSNTCEVHFEDTPVPVENVLGEVGEGFKVAMNILNSGRFSMGSSGAGVLKKLIGMVAEHASARKQFDTKLSEFGLIQEKIARMTRTAYAMESMAYLTAGMLDRPGPQDCSVEAAIVKIYSSEGCWQCVSDALQILGGLGYMKDYPYERYLRDARIMMIFEGTNEILRLYVTLTGFKYAGSDVKANFFTLGLKHYLKMIFPQLRRPIKNGVENWVHSDLKNCARQLDEILTRFHTFVVGTIFQHRKGIIDQQLILKRCADIVINMYAMTACLSRASRSKSIGLPNCDHEILLTKAICDEAYNKVLDLFDEINYDSESNGDVLLQEIGRDVCDYRRYKAEHPLTIFWS